MGLSRGGCEWVLMEFDHLMLRSGGSEDGWWDDNGRFD